ncbi:hypothetical protein BD311DRAFT_807054 [Dichomitus squalens]|uniref:F-box domain-containing protein n=1 Tax=Dichomitus squalens TaxID=114155 RepID=A0A4Q9MKV4_9APHY|nr:hypothetical protein BD311DRAFT_807054 [Dichomitus squalens]
MNLTRLSSLASLAIQSVSVSALYSLTTEFYSNELDILMRVAISFPNLRKLKLNEIRRSTRLGNEPGMIDWNGTVPCFDSPSSRNCCYERPAKSTQVGVPSRT